MRTLKMILLPVLVILTFLASSMANAEAEYPKTITISGKDNCNTFPTNRFQKVSVESGSHSITLTDSDFDFHGGSTPYKERWAFIFIWYTDGDDDKAFTLNGIGAQKTLTFKEPQTIYMGFFDDYCTGNSGTSTLKIDDKIVTISAVNNCNGLDKNVFEEVSVESGSYTITLTDSDFDFHGGRITPYKEKWAFIFIGGTDGNDDKAFTLNGIGDQKTLTFEEPQTIYMGFLDDNNSDNSGSSTLKIDKLSEDDGDVDKPSEDDGDDSTCFISTAGRFQMTH